MVGKKLKIKKGKKETEEKEDRRLHVLTSACVACQFVSRSKTEQTLTSEKKIKSSCKTETHL